jgi:uncharacterized membrane protein YfcA
MSPLIPSILWNDSSIKISHFISPAGDNSKCYFLGGGVFMHKKWWGTLGGFGAGVINGLLGAGGGMVVVPLLSALGVRGKKSHATALMVIVPLSLVSAILYLVQGRVTVMDALPWLPGSLLGAYLGSRLMPKISTGWLKLVFGGLMLWGGIRLL